MPLRIPPIFIRTPGLILAIGGGAAGCSAYFWHTSTSTVGPLNQTTFTPFTLVAKQAVSSTSSIFTLRSSNSGENGAVVDEIRKRGCVWSVQAKQPLLQIARSYTPLPPPSSDLINTGPDVKNGDVRLLIRREENGEVSGYLHNLPLKSTLELRGPHAELEIPSSVTEILFLAGGTGIAPALQVADILSKRDVARCQILWANRRREDCVGGGSPKIASGLFSGWRSLFGLEENVIASPSEIPSNQKSVIVAELEALKSKANGRIRVEYFVDDENSFIRPGHVLGHIQHNLRHGHLAQEKEGEQKLILVSGPDGFIEHWAGKKVWIGGHEAQGPLGGVLGQLALGEWKVWKL